MDSFAALKRRTTDLLHSLPQSLPALPSLPSLQPQHTAVTGTWERIAGAPPLPRSSHSLDVVAGTAYLFGGESAGARTPADGAVHAVTLPASGAGADYYAIPARAVADGQGEPAEEEKGRVALRRSATDSSLQEVPLGSSPSAEAEGGETGAGQEGDEGGEAAEMTLLGAVPAPRVGHASAVIGSRIFVFGGRSGVGLGEALEERGRVWVFDTRTHLWRALDPATPAGGAGALGPGGEPKRHWPAARSYHAAVAVAKPDQFGAAKRRGAAGGGPVKPPSRADTWRDWARSDSDEVGIPQRPIVGHIAAEATDADAEGFGTFIVHGGCLADGGRAGDTWAFDVRSRVWQELPPAPGKPRGGAALCVSKSKLYRFGGFNGQGEEGGQLDVLDLVVDTFDDQVTGGAEATVTARGAWTTLAQYSGVEYTHDDAAAATAPLAETASPADAWPGPRSVASLEALNVGGGREYLVLMLGERDPSGAGHAAAGKFWDDVWVFQVPPQGMSAASLHDAVLQAMGKKSGEGKWTKVETRPYDDEDDASAAGPGPRGWIASAPMGELEENAIVIWGGLNAENKRLGDGWIFRLG